MKPSPIGRKLLAPMSPVGEFVFIDLISFDILTLLFLPLPSISQFGNEQPALLGAFIIVVTII